MSCSMKPSSWCNDVVVLVAVMLKVVVLLRLLELWSWERPRVALDRVGLLNSMLIIRKFIRSHNLTPGARTETKHTEVSRRKMLKGQTSFGSGSAEIEQSQEGEFAVV